jgi:mono/diheme cytochrome c family protein
MVLACALTVGLVAAPGAQSKGAPAASPKTLETYRLKCQTCHGENGVAPVKTMGFVGREWKHGTTVQAAAKVITEGVKGTAMLPFKAQLTKDEILALARLVRSFDKK